MTEQTTPDAIPDAAVAVYENEADVTTGEVDKARELLGQTTHHSLDHHWVGQTLAASGPSPVAPI